MTKNNKSGLASWLPQVFFSARRGNSAAPGHDAHSPDQEAQAPIRQPRGPPGFGPNGEAPAERSAEREHGFKWFQQKAAAKAAAAEKAHEKAPVEKADEKAIPATAQANLTAMAMARAPLEQNDAEVAVGNCDIKPSKEVCAAAQRDELPKQETDAGMVNYASLTKDTPSCIENADNESTMANASDEDNDKRE